MAVRSSLVPAAALLVACAAPAPPAPRPAPPTVADLRDPRETHLGPLTQLTAGGENAEAYWSFAGDRLIFQTTRPGVPCDQIMVMAAAAGATPTLASTGQGRTTCAYFFPGDQTILYASTHEVDAGCPAPPDRSQGYVWPLYDYDLYTARADGSGVKKLAGVAGAYDAEATVCARDGSVVFTSDRDGDLELYRMDQDGGNLTRLTHTPGYDGGAFFSADCSQIVWRASRPTGDALADYQRLLAQDLVRPTKLEIWVANADGSEARQVTYLDAASFAPFFHPSGERILFSSNYGDPRGREFDLWAVDVDGTDLERVTFTPGFDGFPMFSPDGTRLAFASNRGAPPPRPGQHGSDTNVFVAPWIDHGPRATTPTAADRVRRSVDYLAADAREGRGVGSAGLDDAITWVEGELRRLGIGGGLADGGFRQRFEVTTGLTRGPGTRLVVDGAEVPADALAPSPVSASTTVRGETVYVGHGIVDRTHRLDDYRGKRVKGKIVVVRRFAPASLGADRNRLSGLDAKAMTARARGAIGMIVVDLPVPGKPEAALPELAPRDGADAGLPIVVVTRAVGARLARGRHTAELGVELTPVRAATDNVVAVIRGGAAAPGAAPLVIGAHLDHLGLGGAGSGALDAARAVHNGADDNASGVAALLEAARTLQARRGELARDVYLVAFSAEERGILGSSHFVANPPYPGVPVAMLNLDMVGRLRDNQVQVLGAESADEWGHLVEPRCAAARLRCQLAGSGYGPSDHMAFYQAGAPVVHFFTGGHLDYHRATDDAPRVNAIGAARIADLVAELATALAGGPQLTLRKVAPPPKVGDLPMRGGSLGTIPTYGQDAAVVGVLLSDVVPDGPAAMAGLRRGDRIVKIGVTEVRNVQDLMLVLGEAAPGQRATIVYVRDGRQATAQAVFGAPRRRH